MFRTIFEKGGRIGRATPFLPRVIYCGMREGHPAAAPAGASGTRIGGDPRSKSRGPDPRTLVLLLVVSVLVSLAVAASASAATLFTNPTPIKIPGSGSSGPASPYPSEIAVSGMSGPITNVTVTLHRVGHTGPDDIDIFLVSPSGENVMLMSDACGGDDIEDFTWVFSQQAPRQMSNDSSDCGEFNYQPTNHVQGFPGDFDTENTLPQAPYGTSLNNFDNEQANGTWSLYVVDDAGIDTGDIEGGWSLSIETGPVDTNIPATSASGGTSGPAGPYPATRTFTTSPNRVISDLDVFINGIWHQRPDDLDMLLVGPEGQKVVLMSDACGSFEVAAFGWRWDDEAPAPMPDGDATNRCGTTTHRPTDYEPGENMPAPAPAGPYSTSLSSFDGTDPNGEWRLFVNDDTLDDTGFFTNRFGLNIATVPRPNRPPVANDDAFNAREDTPLAIPAPGLLANDTDPDTDTLTSALVSGPTKGALTLDPNGSFLYRPNPNLSGADSFTYTASDGKGGTDTATVTINVTAVNDPPSITPISPQPGRSTRDETPLIRARVRDVETNLAKPGIRLFVDERRVAASRFAYNRSTDVLSHTPRAELGKGRHTVRVIARDAAGRSVTRLWTFRVV